MQKTVLITGSSAGFGRLLVGLFLEKGWAVCATMRRADSRRQLFAEHKHKFGESLQILDLDVTDQNAIQELPSRFSAHFERLDCLINNAGYGMFGSAEESEEKELRQIMECNFFGAVAITRALLPKLRQSRGQIICVSSMFGLIGFPLTSAYCASKFAMEGYFESLSYELRPLGVRVSLVEPGGHRTSFITNSAWTEASLQASSPYYAMAKGYRKIQDLLTQKSSPNRPEAVCQRILKIAEAKNPPLRNYCGKDAWLARLAHAMIPRNMLASSLAYSYSYLLPKIGSREA